jgi:hypothetical protein
MTARYDIVTARRELGYSRNKRWLPLAFSGKTALRLL